MQVIITDAWIARTRAIHLTGTRLLLGLIALAFTLMVLAAALYHWVFLTGARAGWPIVSPMIRFVIRDEIEQRERFVRENVDAMARKLGEMQARMLQLESLGERVGSLAGVNPAEVKNLGGRGGAFIPAAPMTLESLQATLGDLDRLMLQREDSMLLLESQLFDQKLRKMMVPTQAPVPAVELGSGFGWRIDPISGRSALHSGLDYPAPVGTPVLAAAGGLVVTQEYQGEYGNLLEIDHGNGLVTRYAHLVGVKVRKGDLVRRGQPIAGVGNTGRSTGTHLHFEVLVNGAPQDPGKFLAAGQKTWPSQASAAGRR